MPIVFKRAGLDQLLTKDGSDAAHIQVLAFGQPGVGKTPWAAQFPDPVFLMADRNGKDSLVITQTPYVDVRSKAQFDEVIPVVEREVLRGTYKTVVLDTISVLQKHVAQGILREANLSSMDDFRQWGELTATMIQILHRLQNLKCNVVVLCHTKDKFESEDKEIEADLTGGFKQDILKEFSFITHIHQVRVRETVRDDKAGKNVEVTKLTDRRVATWKGNPSAPFLRSPSRILGDETPVDFAASDYRAIADRISGAAGKFAPSTVVSEDALPTDQAVAPGESGPVEAVKSDALPKARAKAGAKAAAKPAAKKAKEEAPAAPQEPAEPTPAPEDTPATAAPQDATQLVQDTLGGQEIITPDTLDIPAEIQQAATADALKVLWQRHRANWSDELTALVKARKAELGL